MSPATRFLTLIVFLALQNLLCSSLIAQKQEAIAREIALEQCRSAREQSEIPYDPKTDGLILNDHYFSAHNGYFHYFFQQTYKEIPVRSGYINVHLDSLGKSVVVAGKPFSDVERMEKVTTTPKVSVVQAVLQAHQEMNVKWTGPVKAKKISDTQYEIRDHFGSLPINLVWLPKDEQVHLVWELPVVEASHEVTMVRIDAHSGQLIEARSGGCAFAGDIEEITCEHNSLDFTANYFAPPAPPCAPPPPAHTYLAFPFDTDQPHVVTPQNYPVVTSAVGSPFGWHDTLGTPGHDFTEAYSNNIFQFDVNVLPAWPPISAPDGGATMDFNYPLPSNDDASSYLDGMKVNGHYWLNSMHDILYQYGFNEVAGNFQNNNYGNGGLGDDPIYLIFQPGPVYGANMAGLPDGQRFGTANTGNSGPNMVMYGRRPPPPKQLELDVMSPGFLARSIQLWRSNAADTFPHHTLTGTLVLADDGTGSPGQGCNPLVNGTAITGNIALFDTSGCSDSVKISHAQTAGASGCIICSDDFSKSYLQTEFVYSNFDTTVVTIPVAYMTEWDCKKLIEHEAAGIQVRFHNTTYQYDRNTGLDNGVVMHEVMHLVADRLVNGPSVMDCHLWNSQTREGWCDWLGLWATLKATDNRNDPVGYGNYSFFRQENGSGARGLPYTANMEINHLTFGDLTTRYRQGLWESGTIWATILWDITWDLVDVYGFDPDLATGTGGNNIALQLVLDALVVLPCTSDYVDARDAILQADTINYGGANGCLLWKAFARRGLGESANQGSATSLYDGTAAFDEPFICSILPEVAIELEATPNVETIQLDWKAQGIDRIGQFTLERKSSEDPEFTSVPGFGASRLAGGWKDKNVVPGVRYYYRIHFQDHAGEDLYSNLASAELEMIQSLEIELFPNPNSGIFTLFAEGLAKGELELTLLNATGQQVWTRTITTERSQHSLSLQLSDLNSGVYLLQLRNGSQMINRKVLIQR